MDNYFQNNQELIQKYLQGNPLDNEELMLADWIIKVSSRITCNQNHIEHRMYEHQFYKVD